MKTIKQLADELGVSKEAIRKQVAKLPPTTVTTGNNRTTLINSSGEVVLKTLVTTKATTKSPTTANTTDKLYDILQAELDAKNKQITDLTAQLDEERKHSREQSKQLAALADTAQRLHAGTLQQQLIGSSADEPPLADEPTNDAPEPEKAPDLEEPSIKELYAACGDANNKLDEKLKKMSNDELRAVSSTIYSAFVELQKREKEEKRGFFGLFRRKA